VIRHHDLCRSGLVKAASKRCYRALVLEKGMGGGLSQGQYQRRGYQPYLLKQERRARSRLFRLRRTIERRSAFDDACDIDIVAGEIDCLQHSCEQVPGPSHKRPSLEIFFPPWGLAYQHEPCIFRSLPIDYAGALAIESAPPAFAEQRTRCCEVWRRSPFRLRFTFLSVHGRFMGRGPPVAGDIQKGIYRKAPWDGLQPEPALEPEPIRQSAKHPPDVHPIVHTGTMAQPMRGSQGESPCIRTKRPHRAFRERLFQPRINSREKVISAPAAAPRVSATQSEGSGNLPGIKY
jgi:hypothetical protein